MLRTIIDGRACTLPPGATILSALESLRIRVPTLCHDSRLAPAGTCRSCLVRVAGRPRLVPACATPLADGMEIETDTPDLVEYRRSLLAMLARDYPADAIRRFPGKAFHRYLEEFGVEPEAGIAGIAAHGEDRSHPYITVNMSRCIHCYRCVRICAELQGQNVWHVRERGAATLVVPDGPTLRDSSCVGCGACVDTCPTGALIDAGTEAAGIASAWTRTVCSYCGVGCEMDVGTRGGHLVSSRPALGAPVNKGHLCIKGRYAWAFADADDRVTEPMIREDGRWRTVSWNEARAEVSTRLRDLITRHGADSIGLLGSARATNEDNYVAQKFARTVIGTNNVDCCARVCHAPSAAGLKATLGTGLATNSFDDIDAARTLLVWGANATEAHPVVGARIRQAARRGARLIVVDPRRTPLAADAALHLAIAPGTDVACLNAMAHTIVTEGLCDRAFLEARVSDVADFQRAIAVWPASRAADVCGVDAEAIRAAARLYATGAPAMAVHGLGLTEHVQGTDGVMALVNLALLTGNIGRRGAGINPMRGQNNVQGAAHMGCDPASLPGSTPVEAGRDAFERRWGAPLPRTRGLTLLEMMDAASAGRLKALWTIGYDILLTNPNTSETARALRSLDLVIVQDLFLTETAREFGTVFLPACSTFEKDGTFMNAERRIQRVRAVRRAAGGSKPDWAIVAAIARTMGHEGFGFRDAEAVWDEIRDLCPGARGMTYARLETAGLQWPCPSEDHPGTPLLHAESFAGSARAALRLVEYRGTPESTSAAFPLLLTTGRSLYQFNAGTMTGRTRNIELRPSDLLDISPDDAVAAGVVDGDVVRVVSAYGAAILPVHRTADVPAGRLFATFHTPSVLLNAVTGPNRDSVTGTPEYKVTAVRLEAAGNDPHRGSPS